MKEPPLPTVRLVIVKSLSRDEAVTVPFALTTRLAMAAFSPASVTAAALPATVRVSVTLSLAVLVTERTPKSPIDAVFSVVTPPVSARVAVPSVEADSFLTALPFTVSVSLTSSVPAATVILAAVGVVAAASPIVSLPKVSVPEKLC